MGTWEAGSQQMRNWLRCGFGVGFDMFGAMCSTADVSLGDKIVQHRTFYFYFLLPCNSFYVAVTSYSNKNWLVLSLNR